MAPWLMGCQRALLRQISDLTTGNWLLSGNPGVAAFSNGPAADASPAAVIRFRRENSMTTLVSTADVPDKRRGIALQVVTRFLRVIHHVPAAVAALGDVPAKLRRLDVGHQISIVGATVERIVHTRDQEYFEARMNRHGPAQPRLSGRWTIAGADVAHHGRLALLHLIPRP